MSSDVVFHPEIEVGETWGRWKLEVTRVERFGSDQPDARPVWFVENEKIRNQMSICANGHSCILNADIARDERARRGRAIRKMPTISRRHSLLTSSVRKSHFDCRPMLLPQRLLVRSGYSNHGVFMCQFLGRISP